MKKIETQLVSRRFTQWELLKARIDYGFILTDNNSSVTGKLGKIYKGWASVCIVFKN